MIATDGSNPSTFPASSKGKNSAKKQQITDNHSPLRAIPAKSPTTPTSRKKKAHVLTPAS
jgi:hypothetical protein